MLGPVQLSPRGTLPQNCSGSYCATHFNITKARKIGHMELAGRLDVNVFICPSIIITEKNGDNHAEHINICLKSDALLIPDMLI